MAQREKQLRQYNDGAHVAPHYPYFMCMCISVCVSVCMIFTTIWALNYMHIYIHTFISAWLCEIKKYCLSSLRY